VESQARDLLCEAGVAAEEIVTERRLDMRFCGQGHEVEVRLPAACSVGDLTSLFLQTYAEVFAATPIDAAVEIVNWKIEASGPRPDFAERYRPFSGAREGAETLRTVRAYRDDTKAFGPCPVIDRYALAAGRRIVGPALIQEDEATTVLGPNDWIEVDAYGNLVATLAQGDEAS